MKTEERRLLSYKSGHERRLKRHRRKKLHNLRMWKNRREVMFLKNVAFRMMNERIDQEKWLKRLADMQAEYDLVEKWKRENDNAIIE